MKRTLLLLSVWGLATVLGLAQETSRTINGTIYTLDDIVCSGISITAKKAGTTVTSDSLGRFSIACAEGDQLVFESKLFRKMKVKISAKTPDSLRVELVFAYDQEKLDLAIGYGYIRQEDRTQAVSQLKKRLGFCSYHDIYDIFRGRFAGVSVVGSEIYIHGRGSVMAENGAMILINGAPYSGDLSSISPCDISRITILKDGSTSIYGSRGANGVVMIELFK